MKTDAIDRVVHGCMAILVLGVSVVVWPWSFEHQTAKTFLVHLVGFIAGGAWILKHAIRGTLPVTRETAWFFLPLGLWMASGMLSFMAVSPYTAVTREELVLRASYVALAAVAMTEWSTVQQRYRFIRWASLALGVVAVYGIIQAIGADPLPWKGSHGARVFSTMGNPNLLAAVLVALIPFVVVSLIKGHARQRPFYVLVLVMGYLALWFAGSRSGIIGAAVATSILAIGCFDWRTVVKWIVVFVVTVAAVFSVRHLNSERYKSIAERRFIQLAALDLVKEKPFLGHGLGTFKVLYPSVRRVETWSLQEKCFVQCRNVYNEFLEVAVEEGIVGLTIFLWLVMVVLLRAMRYRERDTVFVAAVIASIVGVLVANTVSLSLRYASTGAFFWITLGLAAGVGGKTEASADGKIVRTHDMPQGVRWLMAVSGVVAAAAGILWAARFFLADLWVSEGLQYSRKAYRMVETEGSIVRDIAVTGVTYESDPVFWEKAIAAYRRALAVVPDSVNALYFLANAFNRRCDIERRNEPRWGDRPGEARTDFERAEDLYRKLEKQAPDHIEVHFERAMLYLNKGDLARAKERLERYIRQKPYFAKAQYYLGWIHLTWGEWEAAEEWLQEALHLNDSFAQAHVDIALVYHKLGKEGLRDESARRAREITPQWADKALGKVFSKAGEYDHALRYLAAARRVRPTDAEVPFMEGWCHIQRREWHAAAAAYRDAIRLNERFVKAWVNLSSVLAEMGDLRAAEEARRRAWEIDPSYVERLTRSTIIK